MCITDVSASANSYDSESYSSSILCCFRLIFCAAPVVVVVAVAKGERNTPEMQSTNERGGERGREWNVGPSERERRKEEGKMVRVFAQRPRQQRGQAKKHRKEGIKTEGGTGWSGMYSVCALP